MLRHRVIPCLLVQRGGLVKTRRFAAPTYIGDPINAIRIFNDKEVDELLVLDIEASRAKVEPNYALIEQCAGECFMPLAYGGGIRHVDQVRRLFSAGVEKVSVQTGALRDLDLVSRISALYGSQSVVVSIDVKRTLLGRYRLYESARRRTGESDWRDFLRSAVAAGAGEVLVNAVDKDGTMGGPDLSLITAAARSCDVPVIACGGVGSLDDIKAAVDAGASAVAAGAFFVYYGPHRAVLITYPRYSDLIKLLDQSGG